MRATLRAALLAAACWLAVPHPVHAQTAEVAGAIETAAGTYGVAPALMYRIARCESTYRWWVTNRWSGAAGLFQFMPPTWRWAAAGAGVAWASPYDPHAAALAAAWVLSQSGGWRHWRACV